MVTLGVIHCFVKAEIQVIDNYSDNETFVKVCNRIPIAGPSVKSKSVRFDRKERFFDAANAGNLPTDALPV